MNELILQISPSLAVSEMLCGGLLVWRTNLGMIMVFEALKEGEELPDVEVDAAGEQDDCDESEDDHRRSDQLVTRTITPHFNGFVSVLFAINLHFSSTQCLQLKSQQLVGQKGQ